jgi:hypothetical protein
VFDDSFLRPHEIYLWWLRVREEPLPPAVALLDEHDVRTSDADEADEFRVLVCWRRALLRLVAGAVLGRDAVDVVIQHSCATCGATDHGAPRVKGHTLQLSTSATSGLVTVAASADIRVGIDVLHRGDELDDASLHAIAQYEAYTKMIGRGAAHLDGDVEVSPGPERAAVSAGGQSFYARRVEPGPAYVAAIVADRRPRAVRAHDATDLLVDVMHRESAA